jgi:hypothetical protein
MNRGLTFGERALAETVFQNSLDYERIRVHNDRYIFFQANNVLMTPNGEIYAPGAMYRKDYAAQALNYRELFIHELAHVWQYQTGVLNPRLSGVYEFVKNGFNYQKAYRYVLESGRDLVDYGMEQQAAMIADYFLVEKSGETFGRFNANTESFERKRELLVEVMAKFIADPEYARVS